MDPAVATALIQLRRRELERQQTLRPLAPLDMVPVCAEAEQNEPPPTTTPSADAEDELMTTGVHSGVVWCVSDVPESKYPEIYGEVSKRNPLLCSFHDTNYYAPERTLFSPCPREY